MANPLEHHQALDVAEDILKHLVEQDDTDVLNELREKLGITGQDIVEAYNVVHDFCALIDNQRY